MTRDITTDVGVKGVTLGGDFKFVVYSMNVI